MQRVEMMRSFGVEPYIVFDGGPLPMKAGTEDDRKKYAIFFVSYSTTIHTI
jgi:exonuclease-1